VLKHTLLLAGATLGTFVVALLGAYMLLPSIAPDAVGTAADSLSTAGPDTTQNQAVRDTSATRAPADSTAEQTRMVQRLRDSLTVVGRLQDSLRTLRKRLRATEQEASTLRARVTSLEGREAKVSELKNALLDMGQRELATVLANVDMRVLGELYQRTSGRSRTQLLRAMSAERTAQFVNQVIGANEDTARDDTTNADSTRGR
jgi:flagellar motility protein MotE (MotC chaperone)